MPKEILKDIIGSFTSEKLITFFRRKSTNFRQVREEYTDVSREQFRDVAKIGEIKFADTSESKLIVVTAWVLKSLSERSGKKAQYGLGKKMLAAGYYDAGIFVFYDTQGSFRFSLIYPQYVGRKKQWSNFRRFTYFVSSELTNKTFLARVGDGDFSSLDKIKDAFSVEKVTKEFYEQYRKLFEALVADLNKNRVFQMVASKNQINTSDFTKKTLGQIVFLYFLQKKGWLGVPQNKPWGEGDKNFISNLYKQAVKKSENFYNDYLEILFYDTLNNAVREGADPSFSKYFNCRIPFLNGGLFEPEYDWKKTIINLENTIFNNIFEVFDRYNFTVEEESPDDKEVAVDPEMLGKVFENLLEENLRKGKGTYYTPREIVHYMCRESLINHLIAETKIDEKLIRNLVTYKDITPEDIAEAMDNPEARHRMVDRSPTYWLGQDDVLIEKVLSSVKVCDPACGSGAFLVGMLNEIVSVRRLLNPDKSEYQMKKEIIENCIYGVDIDPGAVEIAKLRLWLSLVVDYELADIEPLPNLDYKIMCGNSLLEELIVGDESIKLFDEKLLNIGKEKKNDVLFDASPDDVSSSGPRREHLQKALLEKRDHLMKLHNSGQLTLEKRRQLDSEIVMLNKELNPRVRKSKTADAHPSLFQEKASHYFDVLRGLHKKYFNEYDAIKKKTIRQQIEDIEFEFIKSSIEEKVKDIDVQIRNLNMQKPEDRKKNVGLMKKKLEYLAIPTDIRESKVRPYFLWHLNFFEVFQEKGGFDVVIANPPYLKERDNKTVFGIINKSEFGNNYHQGKMDYWYYFLHKAVDLSRIDGTIAYITSRYWLNSSGARKLIQRIQNELSFTNIVDIGKLKVFDEVSGHHMVAIYKKNKACDKFVYKKLENDISDIDKTVNTENVQVMALSNKDIFHNDEIIFKKDEIVLKEVIDLGQISNVSQGVVEAIDKLSKKSYGESRRKDIAVGDGVFVLNKEEVARLKLNSQEKGILKLYIDPSDVWKYHINWSGKYLIYGDKQAKEDIKRNPDFINIKRHLDRFKKFITSSNGPYGLHRARDLKYFVNPKIIVKNMFVDNQFAFDTQNCFVGMSFSSIIKKDQNFDLKYILALLNSKFALRWFYQNGKARGAGVDIGVDKLRSFPIKKSTEDEQKPFVEMVDKILEITGESDYPDNAKKQSKVKEYSQEIDQMVYKLYGLTEEEIKIVEGDLIVQNASELVKNRLDKAGSV